MSKPIVVIKNLHKRLGGKTIIQNLNFEVYPGEIFGFLGPNGAGKTTAIRMMVGLLKIDAGDILIKNHSIKSDFKKAISFVGGIVESPDMYKFLSGWKNLIHYSRMHKCEISKEKITDIVKLVGLEDAIHRKVKHYSLGMRQRLGIAQSLLHDPSLLILDEPTNGLDPAGIREIRTYLRKLVNEKNISVIVSSHILSEMELMCDRIGIIKDGKSLGIQPVNEIIKRDIVEVYMDIDDPTKANNILSNSLSTKIKDNSIFFDIHYDDIPSVIELLVTNKMKIYSVRTNSKSLEEKFIEITGGDNIVKSNKFNP
ncbi:bacitracin ABC transporter ATP-binding protein [Bacillus manliponensis]|uniref:Bacitracin ABC transporter ATP-binding protein n=1 Tax=Bacillus manliponensis TaxID=574376 RepID=A0A073K6L3_9BACI|nr:ABC transporter ATP-binding protein [Bacillus manliponensis]KEK17893.1 bacitracin ABC transporter ATP-binding protein [Bacillus manliponensis]